MNKERLHEKLTEMFPNYKFEIATVYDPFTFSPIVGIRISGTHGCIRYNPDVIQNEFVKCGESAEKLFFDSVCDGILTYINNGEYPSKLINFTCE